MKRTTGCCVHGIPYLTECDYCEKEKMARAKKGSLGSRLDQATADAKALFQDPNPGQRAKRHDREIDVLETVKEAVQDWWAWRQGGSRTPRPFDHSAPMTDGPTIQEARRLWRIAQIEDVLDARSRYSEWHRQLMAELLESVALHSPRGAVAGCLVKPRGEEGRTATAIEIKKLLRQIQAKLEALDGYPTQFGEKIAA